MSFHQQEMVASVMLEEGDDGFLQINEIEAENPESVRIPNVSHLYHPSQSYVNPQSEISRGHQNEFQDYELHGNYKFESNIPPQSNTHFQKPSSPIQEQTLENDIKIRQEYQQIDTNPSLYQTNKVQVNQNEWNQVIETYQIQQKNDQLIIQPAAVEICGVQLPQRRREAFQNIKIWYESTKLLSDTHLDFVEDVFETLNKRSSNSSKSIISVVDFIREYITNLKHEVNFYSNQSLSKIYSDKDKSGLNFPQLNEAMQDLLNQQKQKGDLVQQQIKEFEEFVDKHLICNMVDYQEKTKEFLELFVSIKKIINDQILIVRKYFQKHSKLYDELQKNNGVYKKKSKDLFYQEKKFSCAVAKQILLQCDQGKNVLSYLVDLNAKEIQRHELVKKSLLMYEGSQHYSTIAINNLTAGNEAQIKLTNNQINIIMRSLNITKVALEEIKYFMVDWLQTMLSNIEYSEHRLVMHSCSQVLQDVGSLIATWKPVSLIITFDHNLIVVEDHILRHKFQIDKIGFHKRSSNPLIVVLKHTVPGLLFKSSQQILLKFPDPQFYDQLLINVNK